jgi:hypothetical protein
MLLLYHLQVAHQKLSPDRPQIVNKGLRPSLSLHNISTFIYSILPINLLYMNGNFKPKPIEKKTKQKNCLVNRIITLTSYYERW